MKKYPKYKPIQIELINDIPEHWDKTRLKYIGFLYGGLTGKSGEDFKKEDDPNNKPFINFTNICNNTYISKDNFGTVSILDEENQNRVEQGDLFFLMSSETQDDIGKSSVLKDDIGEVYLNSFCKGFRINKKGIDPLFLNYLLNGNQYRQLMSVDGKGFTRINLRQDKVKDFFIFLPTPPEQSQIVDFLDQKTSIIDDLIQKKLRKIELLKEQRTTIINHTVTKGLNPNVKMKPSGVEWIGEIPEHWNPVRMKYLCEMITEKGETSEEDFKISPENVESYTGICFNLKSEYNGEGMRFKKGDVLFNKLRIYLVKILYPDFDGYSMGEMIVLRPRSFYGRYLFYTLFNQGLIDQLNSQSTGVKLPRVSPEIILNSFLPSPPLPEQHQIVEYLDKKTTEIDTTITLENKKIELLKEYRQTLISDVVTGKLDVRKN